MNNKKKTVVAVAVFLIAALFVVGIFVKGRTLDSALHHFVHKPVVAGLMSWIGLSEETVMAGRKVYWCPMHPQIHRDKPGACPICNMQLVEMSASAAQDKGDDGSIVFTSRQLQQAGVRYAAVSMMRFTRTIETSGTVSADERSLKMISAWAPGRSRIERLFVNFTGAPVDKGEPLISIYNPDFLSTQEEYRMLLKGGTKRESALLKSVEARLSRWGISREEIKKFRVSKKTMERITIHSPMSGTVIERMVSEGQYVTEGTPLLKLADLSRVWIYADIYENELLLVKAGMPVEVFVQGKTIKGKISFIDPVVQNDSRTVKIRFEVANKTGFLRPGMYAKVRISIPGKNVLAIPESAALFTGRRVIVFVSEGDGVIFPVEVKLGRKWFYAEQGSGAKTGKLFFQSEERYHEILSGLDEGEQVVTSANFLIAAEAQFQGALKKLAPPELSGNDSDLDSGK